MQSACHGTFSCRMVFFLPCDYGLDLDNSICEDSISQSSIYSEYFFVSVTLELYGICKTRTALTEQIILLR